MKIVIAPDSFKGSLSALEVARSIERGIKNVNDSIDTVIVPMADGGEGTVQALIDASGGEIIEINVHDPLFRGKTPFGVAQTAKEKNIPVIALAGGLGQNYKSLYAKGFNGIFSIADKPMTLQEAVDNAALLLEDAAENLIRFWISNKYKK